MRLPSTAVLDMNEMVVVLNHSIKTYYHYEEHPWWPCDSHVAAQQCYKTGSL